MNPALWWLLGGLVVAGGTVAVVAASKPKEDAGPAPFLDANAYFKDITTQTNELATIGANRDAENNARVAEWRKAAKQIPVIGDYAGYLIDLGQWLGKVLGSNYAEQNSPEDLRDAANWIALWIERGYVPPHPEFTAKNGAKFYAEYLSDTMGQIDSASEPLKTALIAYGRMTMALSANDAMKRGIADAASGNGSLRTPGWFGEPPKMVGCTSIAAGIAASQFNLSYDELNAYALIVNTKPPSGPYSGGTLAPIMNIFTAVMARASEVKLGKAPLLIAKSAPSKFSAFDRS